VVLNRAVDEGQTVAASFNTPTLFSIANDLTQMQVEASIDEADIGQVKDSQRVEFTADAFPDLKFAGVVTEIRLQPVEVSNVVTYTVIVKAPNPEKKLMPGMTANITIVTEESTDVLVVPAKALRFVPDSALMHTYMQHIEPNERPAPDSLHKPFGRHDMRPMDGNQLAGSTQIWVKEGEMVRPMMVAEGLNDGINIEIKEGLKEGDEVVLSMSSSTSATTTKATTARSPFMPTPPRRR
jgi:HlyD family secretion protein